MNVIRFLHAIGGQFTAALAVAARIWKQNRVAVLQEETTVPGHAFSIVGNSVQQNYRIAVVVTGMDKPALERCPVSGSDRYILQFSAKIRSHGCGNGWLMTQWKAMEIETEIGNYNSGQN